MINRNLCQKSPEIARPNLVGGIATYPSEKWWSESEWVTVGMMIISQLFMENHFIAMFQSPPVIHWHGFQHPIGELGSTTVQLGSTGFIWVPGTPRVGCGSKCSCKMANSASPKNIPWSSQETWVGWIIQSAENHTPSCICYYTILSMVNLWLIIGNIISLVVWNMIYDSTNLSIVLDDLCEENHSGNTSSLRPSCSRFLMICKSM